MTISYPLAGPTRTPLRRGKGRFADIAALQGQVGVRDAHTYPMADGNAGCIKQESRSSSDPRDGQMPGTFEVRQDDLQTASHRLERRHLRSGASSLGWIPRARLQPRTLVGWSAMKQDFSRSRAGQVRVRPFEVVPSKQGEHLAAHRAQTQRDRDGSEPFLLDGANETFGHRDAAMLTHGAESRLHASLSAPLTEHLAELHAAVGDRVLRGAAYTTDSAIERRSAARSAACQRQRSQSPHARNGRRRRVPTNRRANAARRPTETRGPRSRRRLAPQ
jgi:hypothetical protein